MKDNAEQSIPSRGSHGDECEFPGGPLFSERFKMAHAAFEWCRDNNASLSAPVNIVTALFSLGLVVKKPTLTDEEREALKWAARSSLAWTNEAARCKSALSRIALSDRTAKRHFAAIRGLVERTK